MPSQWYINLAKPSWTPAPETIGLIWSVLYPIILLSFFFVVWKVARGEMDHVILWVFLANLIANLLFTFIQFGLKNFPLASLDILVVWGTIVWIMVGLWPKWPILALAQAPYLVWVSVALVLQFSITWMNL